MREKRPVKKGTFGRLVKYMIGNYPLKSFIVLVCIIFSSTSSVIGSTYLKRLIDECIVPGMDKGLEAVMPQMSAILIRMMIIYALGVAGNWINSHLSAEITQGTMQKLRNEMFRNMEQLPIRFFDTHLNGDIMSAYTNDIDSIRQFISRSFPGIISSGLAMLSVIYTMLSYSIWMTLIVGVMLVGMMLMTKRFGGRSAKYMKQQQESLANEEGFIEEMIQGQKVVQVFCHEEETKKDFVKLNDKLYDDGVNANKNGNVLGPILGNMGNILYVVLAFIGGILFVSGIRNLSLKGFGELTIGTIISFLGMSRQLSFSTREISMNASIIALSLAGAARVFEIIDEEPEADEGYVTLVNAVRDENGEIREAKEHTGLWAWKHFHRADGTTTYTELKGDVVMEHVDFGYVPEKQVLFDISLYAKPGQKIAFVGATGAGKTTITNLINRFYDIPDGKIRYDGININKIKKPDLRRSLGIVLQDVNLFTGTVMENIRYGNLDASDEDCIRAAKLANADDFITRLPEGYDTMLTNNGSQLSQGQRQLISIARAAVADPPVMILDEATSSIDTRTEALVQKGMDNLMKGRTVFVIAHRLSTVRNSNAIMVLDHGRIIERGTHDDLLNMKGVYYQLYTGAFELE